MGSAWRPRHPSRNHLGRRSARYQRRSNPAIFRCTNRSSRSRSSFCSNSIALPPHCNSLEADRDSRTGVGGGVWNLIIPKSVGHKGSPDSKSHQGYRVPSMPRSPSGRGLIRYRSNKPFRSYTPHPVGKWLGQRWLAVHRGGASGDSAFPGGAWERVSCCPLPTLHSPLTTQPLLTTLCRFSACRRGRLPCPSLRPWRLWPASRRRLLWRCWRRRLGCGSPCAGP